MSTPPTPEVAFRLGAEAMRTHLAAWAMSKGLVPVAIDILNMPPPPFSIPESFTIEAPK
jgi:hypothetical protein